MDGRALTRRGFLGGGALLALGWVAAFAFGHRPLGATASSFLGSARRTLVSAFEAILPSLDDAEIAADGVDSFLATGDPVPAGQLWMALVLLEHTGGVGPLQIHRFSRLDVEQRRAVLASWQTSSVGLQRQVFAAVRKAAIFAHYSRPETWSALGYDGPWVKP